MDQDPTPQGNPGFPGQAVLGSGQLLTGQPFPRWGDDPNSPYLLFHDQEANQGLGRVWEVARWRGPFRGNMEIRPQSLGLSIGSSALSKKLLQVIRPKTIFSHHPLAYM